MKSKYIGAFGLLVGFMAVLGMASVVAGESLTDQQIGRQIEHRLSGDAFHNVTVSVHYEQTETGYRLYSVSGHLPWSARYAPSIRATRSSRNLDSARVSASTVLAMVGVLIASMTLDSWRLT